MKLLSALLLSLFISTHAFSVTYEIIGPCDETPLAKGEVHIDITQNVGVATLGILTNNQIPFQGTAGGMNSIYNTPVGLESIEVLSDTKMRSYGWCYRVDGVEPAVMTDQYFFPSQDSHLTWIYGYSTYDSGNWFGYCDHAYELKPEFLCK
ncbi:MAG: hypothetical protein ACI9QD_000573 [Thermoproteota archaeon]|jgi:hypothetical protein